LTPLCIFFSVPCPLIQKLCFNEKLTDKKENIAFNTTSFICWKDKKEVRKQGQVISISIRHIWVNETVILKNDN